MIEYVICAGLSTFLVYISDRIRIGRSRQLSQFAKCFFILIAAMIPCILAGLRDNTIGTDTSLYGIHIYNAASQNSFMIFMKDQYTSVEPLFKLWAYIVSIPKSRFIFFAGLEAACVIPVFVRLIQDYQKEAWIGVMIYYFWLFGFTLNIMRQSIAIALLFWGSKYIYERNIKKFSIVVLAAMGFHLSAVVGLAIYAMYVVFAYDPLLIGKKTFWNTIAKKYSKIMKPFFLLFLIFLIFNTSMILVKVSTMIGRYSAEVKDLANNSSVGPGYLVLVGSILVVLTVYIRNSNLRNSAKSDFFPFTILCGILIFYMSVFSGQLFRISLYFTSYLIPFSAYVCESNSRKKIRKLVMAYVVLVLIAFVYYYYVRGGWNAIYPYKLY